MTNEQRETISQVIGALWTLANCQDKMVAESASQYAEVLVEMLNEDEVKDNDR